MSVVVARLIAVSVSGGALRLLKKRYKSARERTPMRDSGVRASIPRSGDQCELDSARLCQCDDVGLRTAPAGQCDDCLSSRLWIVSMKTILFSMKRNNHDCSFHSEKFQ